MKNLKNLLLVVTTTISVISILNVFGVAIPFPKANATPNSTLPGAPPEPVCSTDVAIKIDEAKLYHNIGLNFINASGIKLKDQYFLNPYTIQHLLAKGNGIILSPTVVDEKGIMFIAYPTTMQCDDASNKPTEFGYVIKTFCPDICDNSKVN